MRILLEDGPILVALGEASETGERFDARDPALVAALARRCGWTGTVHSAEQVHGTRILRSGEAGPGDAFLLRSGEAAAIRIADCWPMVVADPVRAMAVVAHCGWRGAVAGLAADSVRTLLDLGSRPDDLSASCGPGISASSFEVGPEVLAAFPQACHARTSRGTPSIDLGAFLRDQLVGEGVRPERIRMDARDTMTDPCLHSHRRDGAHAGRMACVCLVRQVV